VVGFGPAGAKPQVLRLDLESGVGDLLALLGRAA